MSAGSTLMGRACSAWCAWLLFGRCCSVQTPTNAFCDEETEEKSSAAAASLPTCAGSGPTSTLYQAPRSHLQELMPT